jgi:hypothetical protein
MGRFLEGFVLIIVMAAFIAAIAYASTRPVFHDIDKSMLGALVGAAGTVFAGWLVWSQSRDQIAATEKQQAAIEQSNKNALADRLEQEILYLGAARERAQRYLAPFAQEPQGGTGFTRQLIDMRIRGELVSPMMFNNGTVGPVATQLNAFFMRLSSLADNAQRYSTPPDNPANQAAQRVINATVEANVAEFRTFASSIQGEIDTRRAQIASLRKR